MTPEQRARLCADTMWRQDAATPALGIALDQVGPGFARMRMTVQPSMLNGYETCHGGYIFALADSAFAFACNTDGMASVAAHCSIHFLNPARAGDHLVATAEERFKQARSGIYDVRIMAGDTVIAEFRGHSRTTGHRLVDDAA